MSESKRKTFIVLVITLFVGFCGFSAVLLSNPVIDPSVISDDVLEAEAERLIALGDASTGDRLINQTYECYACHVGGVSQIAPDFEMLAEHAYNQRPDLSPVAYLYESIVYPAAHLVEGYPNSMPNNYRARLSDEEIGSMLAYLLVTYVEQQP